ncbi:MAG: hypothetical protein LUH02_03310 [Erysipelotrichaceae bacterium]|nr:hypothetical protein [Erysipelotrichaceae bacterium]
MKRIYKIIIDDEEFDDVMIEEDEYTEELLRNINCLNTNYTRLDNDMDKIYNLLNVIVDFFITPSSDNSDNTSDDALDNTINDDLDNSEILF